MKPVALFSKHLGWLTIDQLGPVASEIGLEAVQLSVRPGGHIDPERAATDLPRAVRTLQLAGVAVPSVVTALTDPADDLTRRVVGAISDAGVPIYRTGWYRVPPGADAQTLRAEIDRARAGLAGFAKLSEELGVRACYENHAGAFLGASPWQLWDLVRDLPPERIGLEFDLRHAMIEGWYTWQPALELLLPWVAMVLVKDFAWQRADRGAAGEGATSDSGAGPSPGAVPVSVPLGEGVVDFAWLFDRLDRAGYEGPVALHLEYEVAGRELQGAPGSVDGAPRDAFTRAAAQAIRADLGRLRAWLAR
ncbi:MAG: sugar phosphate isomerase/epimerase family protein [bacterium]